MSGRNSLLLKSIECCMSDAPDKCAKCPYEYIGAEKCINTLLAESKSAIELGNRQIASLETELRRSNWGNSYR